MRIQKSLLLSLLLVGACKARNFGDTSTQSFVPDVKLKIYSNKTTGKTTAVVSGRSGNATSTSCAEINPAVEESNLKTVYICRDADFGTHDDGEQYATSLAINKGSKDQRATVNYSGRGGAFLVQMSCKEQTDNAGLKYVCAPVPSYDRFATVVRLTSNGENSKLIQQNENGEETIAEKLSCTQKNLSNAWIFIYCTTGTNAGGEFSTKFSLIAGTGDSSTGAGLREVGNRGYGFWTYSCWNNGRDYVCRGQ